MSMALDPMSMPGMIQAQGYTPSMDLSFERAERIFLGLLHLEEACPWWIGDLLNFSEVKFGEECSQMLASLTIVEWDTVRRYIQVAKAYPIDQRMPGVSFSHHRELLNVPEPDRTRWLIRCADEHLSVRDLRKLRHEEHPGGGQKDYHPDLLALIRAVTDQIVGAWNERNWRLLTVADHPDGDAVEVVIKRVSCPAPAGGE